MTREHCLLLVDDDARIRRIIVELLSVHPVRVTVAASIRQALCAAQREAPDAALVDLGLPDGDGIELLAMLHQRQPTLPLVVLTVASTEARILAALRAGACGYLFKEDIGSRLVPGVLDALDGGAPMSPAVARMVLARAVASTSSPARPSSEGVAAPPLSSSDPAEEATDLKLRERQVLDGIARGLTYEQIGVSLDISANTVRTYIRSLYEKLDVATKAEAVASAMRRGLLG